MVFIVRSASHLMFIIVGSRNERINGLINIVVIVVGIISMILQIHYLRNGNVSLGKIVYILVHIGTKSVSKLAKELKLHRNTVGKYHRKIRGFLLENNVDPKFNGEIEMDELYVIAGEKGIKKTLKKKEHLEKEG